MMRVFIDTNIFLDYLLRREPFFFYSYELFALVERQDVRGYASPITFSDLAYLLGKVKPRSEIRACLRDLRRTLTILSVNEEIIDLALSSSFTDFEDAIQYYTAVQNDIPFLITRNTKDYKKPRITICTAQEYLELHRRRN
jgi:predicted nucleic acid-binding protein